MRIVMHFAFGGFIIRDAFKALALLVWQLFDKLHLG
jgi:hypothetical protein